MATESPAPDVGRLIGPYRVVREVGRGGMGVVYEAIHERIGQRVALKMLSARLAASARGQERCMREARACCQVQHPGLVRILDYKQLDDGTPYIVMEYLDGQLLRERLRQPLSLAEVIRVASQLAAALAAAHREGIVHRDLKPENVMLVADGEAPGGERVKILDFGIAKFLDAPDLQTLSESAAAPLGTPAYMSPEQCQAQAQIDGRSDVYALGVMLYEMACGRLPFVADSVRQLFLHVHQNPKPPSHYQPAVPLGLDALVMRMLAKVPTRRPSMAEVAAALQGPLLDPWSGTRVAWTVAMVLLLLLLLPILGEFLYYQRCHTFWRFSQPTTCMALIPGCQFAMGSTPEEVEGAFKLAVMNACSGCRRELYERETPQRTVEVSPFLMDRTEVTNQQFASWLNQLGLRPDRWQREVRSGTVLLVDLDEKDTNFGYRGIEYRTGEPGQQGRFVPLPEMADKPVVMVTWDGALRYCQAQGKRLPTEAEWELAARGFYHYPYPWGFDLLTCDAAVFGRIESNGKCKALRGPAAVGSMEKDRSPFGVYDLGGNVSEWVMDSFHDRYPPDRELVKDPVVLDPDASQLGPHLRVVRGGAWFREVDSCRAAGRGKMRQQDAQGDTGFRCVRPLAR